MIQDRIVIGVFIQESENVAFRDDKRNIKFRPS